MRYVMGLDGGGTKTVAVLADETGAVLGWGRGGPMNISFVSPEAAREAVTQAMQTALLQAGVAAIDLVCVGSAGPVDLIQPDDAVPVRRWQVVYEHGLCFAGALQQGDGVVVLAGTGSFQWARGPRGQHRVDGKGALIGDEGSAYWIARSGLVAVGRAHDGRGPATALTGLFLAHLGVADELEMARRIYRGGGMPRHEIAGLAPLVTAAAGAGDPVALGICREAADLLAHGALVCVRQTGLSGREFPVVLSGSVISAGAVITTPLIAALQAHEPGARPLYPRYEPAVGGVLAGLQALSIPWTEEVLANLNRTLKQRGDAAHV